MNITRTEINLEVLGINCLYHEDGSLNQDDVELVLGSESSVYKKMYGLREKESGRANPRKMIVPAKFAGRCTIMQEVCFREWLVEVGYQDDEETILKQGSITDRTRQKALAKLDAIKQSGAQSSAEVHTYTLNFDLSENQGRFYDVYGADYIPDRDKKPVVDENKTSNNVQ